MNNIKNVFTSTDLENITGIKAHTIRMWERRYNLFQPVRASRNIRYYNIESLQKLLNIDLLRKQGLKISKIAALSEADIILKTKEFVSCDIQIENACNQIKLAMYQFDTLLFEQTYQELIVTNSFNQVYQTVFTPFLHFIGLLWQTQSVTPAHEHFISNLIYQKIQTNIEQLPLVAKQADKPSFVLYLHEEEMHEIGLLYLNYELRLRGFHTVYLGRTIPLTDLNQLKNIFPIIYWVCIFTIAPSSKMLTAYMESLKDFLEDTPHHYWAIGQKISIILPSTSSPAIKVFPSIKEALAIL